MVARRKTGETKKKGERKRMAKKQSLEEAANVGQLKKRIGQYLKSCRAEEKKNCRFPNLAGFCRWMGCGMDAVDQLRLTHPADADYLAAVMEDEALNSPVLSPTVVGAYQKRRLAYGEKAAPPSSLADCGEVRLVFEHDIAEDGE